MKALIVMQLLAICLACNTSGEILDTKVPWTGTVRNTSLHDFLNRVQGWAEGQKGTSVAFVFKGERPAHVINNKIRFTIKKEDGATYRAVLSQAFRKAGIGVALTESNTTILITPIYTYVLRLKSDTLNRLKASKMESTEGISKKVKSRVGKLSEHFWLNYMGDGVLSFGGTQNDVEKVARFFGKYKE